MLPLLFVQPSRKLDIAGCPSRLYSMAGQCAPQDKFFFALYLSSPPNKKNVFPPWGNCSQWSLMPSRGQGFFLLLRLLMLLISPNYFWPVMRLFSFLKTQFLKKCKLLSVNRNTLWHSLQYIISAF